MPLPDTPNARVVSVSGRTHHVTVEHYEQAIHKGLYYTSLTHRKMAAGEFIDITMTVPDGYRVHFNYAINSGLETQLQVYADTIATGGTVGLARNRNEESTNTIAVSVRKDGTITDPGVLLADIAWGTSGIAAVSPSSGGDQSAQEIMWPANAVRRFRLTSLVADNNVVVRLNFLMEEIQE